MMQKSSLFNSLSSTPIQGLSLANVTLLRLDQLGGNAPGNKWFKLQGNISQARSQGMKTLATFGGAWSNHLHALAATGRELGLQTIGIVRGEEATRPSAMLQDARRWGMKLVYVSREEYRRRDQPEYIDQIQARFAPCLVIPEGGANRAGVEGCRAIGRMFVDAGMVDHRVVLAVGTGSTLAGVAAGLGAGFNPGVVGVSVLKGALDLDARVAAFAGRDCASWRILHNHHCGGYARVNPALREFILAFEAAHHIQLDPVYTGKVMYAVHQLITSGKWGENDPIAVIHTGGLQGRRGFPWLC
ncbi:MAG: hypothetical protein DRR04_12445 [Gammaproteobacteria bacterium]|nr:MAG: hypothetical protein DRR04_12445 [Gammaproteobacteria bacterium]